MDLGFIGELTTKSHTQICVVDENVFTEGEEGDRLYYILSGRVCILHRQTMTYIEDLVTYEYFGEYAFFSDRKRMATAKSRDFT